MLSSLKEKLLNVKQNVPLFNSEEKESRTKQEVNVYAGAGILKHFQDQWEELHGVNYGNAKRADELANEIERISSKMAKDKENITLISHILLNSNLSTNITNCLSTINDLYRISETLEKDLINLEKLIDDASFQNLKTQHTYHLAQYQLRKEESLENFKKSLEEKHTKKVNQYEANKKSLFQERQKVFQDAFKTDLEVYKNVGALPEVNQRKQNGALLEEIQIDFDQTELDRFFSDNVS